MNTAKHGPLHGPRGLGRLGLWASLPLLLLMLLPQQAQSQSQQPAPLLSASTVAPASTRPVVRLTASLLSVKAVDVKLVELLDEVSRQAGFAVVPCEACEQRISLRFDRLPLEQGLSMILRDQHFVLSWRAEAAGRLVPHRLWLLPQPGTRPSARRPASDVPRSERERAALESHASPLRSALAIGTPDDREQAAAAMGQVRDPRAVAPLARALADSDAQVRRAAIESLAEIGGADAVGAMALALRDSEPRLREAAVNALGDLGGPKAMALLRQAQQDPTSFVRQAAIETLDELQRAQRH